MGIPSSAGSVSSIGKMSLKAREFGKEITNATITSNGNNMFSSTMHP
jgi:hypothetical protein